MKKQAIIIAVVSIMFYSSCMAEVKPESGVSLTVYNDNYGVVKEARMMNFEKGINRILFTDVASSIDSTSVNFECLSAPGSVKILEQNYQYDLVNAESLMKRYIDKDVTVVVKGSGSEAGRKISGKLMAAVGNDLIVQGESNLEIISRSDIEAVTLKQMPKDLVTKPTLVWLADAKDGGEKLCQVTYTTGDISWKADYSAILNADDTALDFSGWVTMDNRSGATYNDAKLKLIAGDVRRVTPPQPRERMAYAAKMQEADMGGFEEKAFMEYHMYTLGRKSTISNNEVKQIEFIEPAKNVAAKKIFLYERGYGYQYADPQQKGKVKVKIEFLNTEENKLGIALPKGKIRVFKKDTADNSLEFVGEDEIDHTPKKEKVSLYIGDAFDVVAEYTLLDTREGRKTRTEKHKIELKNRKTEPVTVYCDEKFPVWCNWTIDESSHKYEKRSANTARFEVKIDADSTAVLTYTSTWIWN